MLTVLVARVSGCPGRCRPSVAGGVGGPDDESSLPRHVAETFVIVMQ